MCVVQVYTLLLYNLRQLLLHLFVYGFLTVTEGWVTYSLVAEEAVVKRLDREHGGPDPRQDDCPNAQIFHNDKSDVKFLPSFARSANDDHILICDSPHKRQGRR